MGLQAVYERFLQSPTLQNLTSNATLQYVTTLQCFSEQGRIIKHLEDQNSNVVKKKSEKIISAVEGLTSVAVVVETSLEFISSGGAYLPGLDTFIIDRTALLPVTHFVHFNQDNQITQIRLSWDQGDLLKQVEVIGARGRNWPVYDGKDQIKMITASATTANQVGPAPGSSPRGRNPRDTNGVDGSVSPSKKYIKDPHASLNALMFRHEEEERRPSVPNPVAPRELLRPEPRDMSDIFVAGHEDYEPTGPGGSPRKESTDKVIAPKGAVHKRYQPSEVFGSEMPIPAERKIYKTNPARYNHFDIGDPDVNDPFQYRKENEQPQDMPIRPKGGKVTQHTAQWDFKDFVTPEEVKQQKIRDQDVVHFSHENGPNEESVAATQPKMRKDAETHFEFQDNGTPVMRKIQPQPRKDIDNHFNMADEPSPAARRIIGRTKAAAGLYRDPVFGSDADDRALAPVSHNARKDLTSHWDLSNDSPVNGKPGSRGQARRGLENHWEMGSDGNSASKKQAQGQGRKDAERGIWDF